MFKTPHQITFAVIRALSPEYKADHFYWTATSVAKQKQRGLGLTTYNVNWAAS